MAANLTAYLLARRKEVEAKLEEKKALGAIRQEDKTAYRKAYVGIWWGFRPIRKIQSIPKGILSFKEKQGGKTMTSEKEIDHAFFRWANNPYPRNQVNSFGFLDLENAFKAGVAFGKKQKV